jgi:protocatechuate 3,4-dioxygenase beta subunit
MLMNIGLPKLRVRDAGTVLNTTHLSPIDYSPLTPLDVIFESNSSCVLSPETTEGPYFVSGEYIRTDLRETQAGVDLILDLQVLDITTCDPVENVWIDFWREYIFYKLVFLVFL